MSFIDSLGSIAKKVGGFLGGDSLGASLAKSALIGFALNKMQKNINASNEQQDQGTRVQVNPDTSFSIPVIYGQAYTEGTVTDAHLSTDNKTMWFCITLSEKTGTLIDGSDSVINFNEVYWNGLRLDFQTDGVTVDLAYDDEGTSTDKFSGLIQVYPFNNGSANPTGFTTESASNSTSANSLFPGWDSNKEMSDLVFCIIKMTYNSKQKVTNLGNFRFKLTNTMSAPGDVLNDYMQNTRYGAGISAAEINIQ